MAVSPSIFSLSYRKNSNQAPYKIVTVRGDQAVFTDTNYQLRNIPSWMNVVLEEIVFVQGTTTNVDHFKFRVSVNTSNANLLANGLHSADAGFRLRVSPITSTFYWQTVNMKVSLTVYEDEPLTIDKTAFQFFYTLGSAAPAAQYLQIRTGSNWSATSNQPWVNFSVANGNGNASITISTDVSGLDPGIYTATFSINDGNAVKGGTITLYVEGSDNSADYLTVSPESIQFAEGLAQAPTKQKVINIDSSLTGTITANVNWLSFSAATFGVDETIITVSTVSTEALTLGSHYADILVTSEYATRKIPVLLQIVKTELSGIEDNGFYFAEDRNKLLLTSSLASGEVLIDHVASSSLDIKKYRKRAPYFRNTANVIIGQETLSLLKPNPIPEVLHTHSFLPIKPVRIDIKVTDRNLTNATEEDRAEFQNLNFINGHTPQVEGVLTHLPSSITAPVDGVICFSFRSLEPVDYMEVSGSRTQQIDVESLSDNIYGVMLRLADFALSPKDKLQLSCGPVNLSVRIKPSVHPTTQIIWTNEWDCPEIYNATDAVRIVKQDDSTLVVRSREGMEYQMITDIKNPKRFTIGTGNLYGAQEIEFISRITEAKQIWLQVNGKRFEVVREFGELLESESRKHVENINLSFKSAKA